MLLTDHVLSLQQPPQAGSPPPPPGTVSGNVTVASPGASPTATGNVTVGPASPGASPTATGNVTVGPVSPGASPAASPVAGQSPQVGYTGCVMLFSKRLNAALRPAPSCSSFAK